MKKKHLFSLLGCIGFLLLCMAALVFADLFHRLEAHPRALTQAVFIYLLLLCLLLACLLAVIGTLLLRTQRDRNRQTEAERERYYLFAQLAGAYLLEFDCGTHTLQVSGEGIQSYTLTLKQAAALCYPEDRTRLVALLRSPPPRHEKAVLECRLRLEKDGPFHWFECKAMAVLDRFGQPLRLVGRLENIERRKAREEALLVRSTLDPLTGLLNKSAITLRTDEFLASPCAKTGGALLMLDLDNFKAINDHCGHSSGDQALLLTAQVLRDTFRRIDLLGRAGGDEFLVFLPGCADRQAVWQKACQLCRTLEEKASAALGEFAFTCSVGAAFYPEDGTAFSALFDAADTAMYTAKRGGKNTCALFGAEERIS